MRKMGEQAFLLLFTIVLPSSKQSTGSQLQDPACTVSTKRPSKLKVFKVAPVDADIKVVLLPAGHSHHSVIFRQKNTKVDVIL